MPAIDPSALNRKDLYRLMINGIVPRPIAWVTTMNSDGVVNLAPFSFFNGVTSSPPIISIAIAHRDPLKDTLANLRSSRAAVVHLVPPEHLSDCHRSGGDYAAHISEAAVLGLALTPSMRVKPPRLACAQVAFECMLINEIPVGDPATSLCLLQIVQAHINDAVAGADGLPDPHRLRAVARLGERSYLTGNDWVIEDHERVAVPPELQI